MWKQNILSALCMLAKAIASSKYLFVISISHDIATWHISFFCFHIFIVMNKEQDPRIVALRLLKETIKSSTDIDTIKQVLCYLIDTQITMIEIDIYKDMVKKYIEQPIETWLHKQSPT